MRQGLPVHHQDYFAAIFESMPLAARRIVSKVARKKTSIGDLLRGSDAPLLGGDGPSGLQFALNYRLIAEERGSLRLRIGVLRDWLRLTNHAVGDSTIYVTSVPAPSQEPLHERPKEQTEQNNISSVPRAASVTVQDTVTTRIVLPDLHEDTAPSLANAIARTLNEFELRELVSRLRWNMTQITSPTRPLHMQAFDVVEWAVRNDRFPDLLAGVREVRPNVLPEVTAVYGEEPVR